MEQLLDLLEDKLDEPDGSPMLLGISQLRAAMSARRAPHPPPGRPPNRSSTQSNNDTDERLDEARRDMFDRRSRAATAAMAHLSLPPSPPSLSLYVSPSFSLSDSTLVRQPL